MFNILTLDKVRKIEVETTTYCNAGCPHCARHKPNTSILQDNMEMEHLNSELIYKLKDDFGEQTSKMDIWYVGNLGDSLMHPHMENMWDFTAKNFRYTEMETNGGARKKDFWKNLGNISKTNGNAMMLFSIDGLEDTNEIYRKKVKWDAVMENVQAYIGAGGLATWKWLIFKHNEHQVEEGKELARKLGFAEFIPQYATRFEQKTYDATPKNVNENVKKSLGKDNLVKLQESEVQHASNISEVTSKKLKQVNFDNSILKVDCKYIKKQRMYLNARGRVWPCCWHSTWDQFNDHRHMDPLILPHYKRGFNNYHTKSMSEIFNDSAWKEMTDAWETESVNERGKQPMSICYRKCMNKKWEALCNIKDLENKAVFANH